MPVFGALGVLDTHLRHQYIDTVLEDKLQSLLRHVESRMNQIEHERREEMWRFGLDGSHMLNLQQFFNQDNGPGFGRRTDHSGGNKVIADQTLATEIYEDEQGHKGKHLLFIRDVFDQQILKEQGFIAAQSHAIQVIGHWITHLESSHPTLIIPSAAAMREYEKHIYVLRLYREEYVYYQSILDKHVLAMVQFPALSSERHRILNELDVIQQSHVLVY